MRGRHTDNFIDDALVGVEVKGKTGVAVNHVRIGLKIARF